MKLRRCTQCGAPLNGFKCAYCDSEFMPEAGDKENATVAVPRNRDPVWIEKSQSTIFLNPDVYGTDRITFKTEIDGKPFGVFLETGRLMYEVPLFVCRAIEECDKKMYALDLVRNKLNTEYARRSLLVHMESQARKMYGEREPILRYVNGRLMDISGEAYKRINNSKLIEDVMGK